MREDSDGGRRGVSDRTRRAALRTGDGDIGTRALGVEILPTHREFEVEVLRRLVIEGDVSGVNFRPRAAQQIELVVGGDDHTGRGRGRGRRGQQGPAPADIAIEELVAQAGAERERGAEHRHGRARDAGRLGFDPVELRVEDLVVENIARITVLAFGLGNGLTSPGEFMTTRVSRLFSSSPVTLSWASYCRTSASPRPPASDGARRSA
jgi:hypothetical protein